MLFPGDLLRAKYISDTFLTNVKQVNNVLNMLGFRGYYNSKHGEAKKVSVMGSGMGIPSCSIYAKELIIEYGVKNIIRVGSCGAISSDIKVRDVIIGMGAFTDSKVNRTRFKDHDFAAIADFNLLMNAINAAKQNNIDVKVGNIFSADLFYSPDPDMFDVIEKMDILGVEMEAAGLYGTATKYGANALCILTVSDHIRTGEQTRAQER